MNSFRRRPSLECQMRSILVVFGFPALQFSSQILLVPKTPSTIKLLGVGLVTALDLAVDLRTSGRDVAMGNAQIGEMPGELWSERRVVVGLDLLDREGKMLTDFP